MLYAEGATAPKMMSVGLHCRLVGRPGRAAALIRFLDYIGSTSGSGCRPGWRSRSTGTPTWRILPTTHSISDEATLGDEIVSRINQLGMISETPEHLARIFLSPEHRIAADLILSWMKDAGMAAHLDAIGNVCGRYEGERPGVPCLMLGSHYDTVRDAGKWDGPLGIIIAIACVA